MESMELDNLYYDYFSNTTSYVKTILDMLPESKVSMAKKSIIKELYNYFLNNYSEEKIKEIASISVLYIEKMAVSSPEEIAMNAEYIYNNFLEKIIFDSRNRDKIFNIMNESMKVYVEYFNNNINMVENAIEYGYAR